MSVILHTHTHAHAILQIKGLYRYTYNKFSIYTYNKFSIYIFLSYLWQLGFNISSILSYMTFKISLKNEQL